VSAKRTKSGIADRRVRAQDAENPGYATRRRQVLEVAAHHFARFGLDGAKLSAIAEEAGVDRANLYYYADGKADLFLQVLHAVKLEAAFRAEEVARSQRTAAARLRHLMVDLMTDVEKNYPFLYVHYNTVVTQLSASHPAYKRVLGFVELTGRHFAAFRKVVEDGIRSGEFVSTLPPWIVARAAVGSIADSHRWFDPGTSELSGEEIGNGFADILLGGLAPEALGPIEVRLPASAAVGSAGSPVSPPGRRRL
jgi:TetR/AcrR family transcriptional regulator, cholesterol catabolism regulator